MVMVVARIHDHLAHVVLVAKGVLVAMVMVVAKEHGDVGRVGGVVGGGSGFDGCWVLSVDFL